MVRTGRRPGDSGTREAILEAARTAFGEHGYDRATIRAIARRAGVDPALVHHFFGTKDKLFAAAMVSLPFGPSDVIPAVLAEGKEGLGERIVRLFLSILDDAGARAGLVALIRSATTNEQAAAMSREFITREILGPLIRSLDVDQPALRASLAWSQLAGLIMARYILRIEPLASADRESLIRVMGSTIHRYLTGPLPAQNATT